jgi:hypothetical protein
VEEVAMDRTKRRVGALICGVMLLSAAPRPFAMALGAEGPGRRPCSLLACQRSELRTDGGRFEMEAARTAAGLADWLPALLPLIVEGVQTGEADPEGMSLVRASRSFTAQAFLSVLAASVTALGKLAVQEPPQRTGPAVAPPDARKAPPKLACRFTERVTGPGVLPPA